MAKTFRRVYVLRSLLVAAFDSDGAQLPELQGNLLQLWVDRAAGLGYHVDGLQIQSGLGLFRVQAKEGGGWEVLEL